MVVFKSRANRIFLDKRVLYFRPHHCTVRQDNGQTQASHQVKKKKFRANYLTSTVRLSDANQFCLTTKSKLSNYNAPEPQALFTLCPFWSIA